MSTLICGSLAFDTIMMFPDKFKNYILPDQIDILNVCFVAPSLRREYGGCAGNIAYNLKLLGGSPVPMGTVGKDFDDYLRHMETSGINVNHILKIPETYSAQCTITTDQDNNQITSFHPGAMSHAKLNKIADAQNINLGIVSPDDRDAMIQHANDFANKNIPFLFDPGQNLPLFSKSEINQILEKSTWCVVNDYESELMAKITGQNMDELASFVDAFVVTSGGNGSRIYIEGDQIIIPNVNVDNAIDPTGCGDAYRAGLLLALDRGWDWETGGRIGSLIGAIKVQSQGTQNHTFSLQQFSELYQLHFDTSAPLLS